VILQRQRATKRRKALQKPKSSREPLTLVFGPEYTSITVAEANTASKDLTASQTNVETIIDCCQAS
jgi:hypothetical protein